MANSQSPAMRLTGEEPAEILARVTGPRHAEAFELLELHAGVSGAAPAVWASRIIGFGERSYLHPSGRGGTVPVLAFASGAREHTIYLVEGFAERWPELLEVLGPHRSSKVCLYITRLARVDRAVLRELLMRTREDDNESRSH